MNVKELLNIRGIVTVLNTPFTADDRIDHESLRKNVRAAIHAGVAGFLVPAMAGEALKLSADERSGIVRAVLDETRGRAPVIGGASAATPAERIALAQTLIELGCEGVLASIPYEGAESYARHVSDLAELKPGFLILQDWDFQGAGIPVPVIVDLFRDVEVFRGIKIEVANAGAKYSEVLAATGGKLHVSGGWAVNQLIEGLDRGVHAFMPTAMHPIYTRIYRLYVGGEREQAQQLFNRLLPVLAFSNQHLDYSIHFFKRLLFAQGLYATPNVREPILPFDEYHERRSRELIALVQTLAAEVGDTIGA
ncbi:MAG: dihydrodipicolinate synthase family protein [Paenibacillus sp.]|nr:dihydrodipicolinate synthase family protein [Paenibacillus sp.]